MATVQAQPVQAQPVQVQAQPVVQGQPVTYAQPVQAQPTYVQQQQPTQTVVVQAAPQQINPACPIITFVLGWFFFPVWWGGCCMLCNPNYGTTGKVFNIISTILGILWAIWIPVVIIVLTTATVSALASGGGLSYYSSSYWSSYYW